MKKIFKNEKEILQDFILNEGLVKSNGLNKSKYLISYVDRSKRKSKEFLTPFEADYNLNISVLKYININNLTINIIKPKTNITTYSDFLSGFIENIHKFDIKVKKSDCTLFENMLNKYEERVLDENIIREINDDYNSLIVNYTSYNFEDFLLINSSNKGINPFLGKDVINIFIMGGDYQFTANKKTNPYLNDVFFFLNSCQPKHTVLNVLGIGHSDFIDPINILSDFSYNTPDSVGGRFLRDLLINSSKSVNHFIIKKPKIILNYL